MGIPRTGTAAPAPSRTALIVDDEPAVARVLSRLLASRGWQVMQAPDGRAAVELCERERPDLVLLDLAMPGLSGMQTLEILLQRDADITVVMMSGNVDVATAVEAMRMGAEGFLCKPIDLSHLEQVAERAFEKSALRRRYRLMAARQVHSSGLDTLGQSPPMRELAYQIEMLADGTAPVLLTGETGCGKGWASKLIHAASARRLAPFVSINCAGLNATFLDSELFGHERGAFTDAKAQKVGLFEVANGGTLMLDEIGDLAIELQPKLLTVLETKRFRRVGGTREIEVDVRLIAATHVDLAAAVKAGRFREDLFYRIAVLPVKIPALRERGRDEIADTAIRITVDLRKQLGRGPVQLSAEALATIVNYPWPGNVRELRNVLERAMIMAQGAEILERHHLPVELRPITPLSTEAPATTLLSDVERRHVLHVLAMAGGNRRETARLLGISRQSLYDRLARYGVEPGDGATTPATTRQRAAASRRTDG